MNLQEALNVDGGNNDGGLLIDIYVARMSTVLTLPTVPAVPTTYADKVTIADDVVFKTGGRFYKIQAIVEKNSLDSKSQGEAGSMSSENILSIMRKGMTKASIGFIEEVKNDDLLVICADINGDNRMLGSSGLPCMVSEFNASSGEKVADHKVTGYKFRSVGRIAPFYEGAISETPAV